MPSNNEGSTIIIFADGDLNAFFDNMKISADMKHAKTIIEVTAIAFRMTLGILPSCSTDLVGHLGKCNSSIPPHSLAFPLKDSPVKLVNMPFFGTWPTRRLKDMSSLYSDAMLSMVSGICPIK
jgi:hypothetical protein